MAVADHWREQRPVYVYAGDKLTGVGAYGMVFRLEQEYVVPEPGGLVTIAVDVGLGRAKVVGFQPRGDF